MTRDDIKRMAQESGWTEYSLLHAVEVQRLETFAALVAEREREACAKVCEKQIKSYMSKQYTTDPLGGFRERFAAEQCAAAIRARGET